MSRPAALCRGLLEALDATEGRRRRRKRDTTADAIGIAIKRELLEACVRDDPDPADFEAWLMEASLAAGSGSGGRRAMARSILEEWKLARVAEGFGTWLRSGAPSDDKPGGMRSARRSGSARGLVTGLCLALAGAACGDRDRGEAAPPDAAVPVSRSMRGDPGSTIYDAPPDLQGEGLSSDSLARIGGKAPEVQPPSPSDR